MPTLPEKVRERAIGMLNAGRRPAYVAIHFGVHVKTIRRLRNRFQQTGSVRHLPRSGRPRVTTRRQDVNIRTSHLRDRLKTATSTARATIGTHNRRIHARTVQRRLKEVGVKARRPYVGPILPARNRRQRLQWAREHVRWTRQQWRNVLFSDETRVSVSSHDGRQRVYRRRHERFADCCVVQADRYGGGSKMFWGGVSYNNKTQLLPIQGTLTGIKYVSDVLRPEVIPFFNANRQMTFQQDNATSHSAIVTRQCLQDNNVNVLEWPARSPDLSPIEHLWDNLKRRVRQRQNVPVNVNDLQRAVLQEWNNIPQREIQTLIDSMRRRCQAVVRANGGFTKY